jgi:hypothetical protein
MSTNARREVVNSHQRAVPIFALAVTHGCRIEVGMGRLREELRGPGSWRWSQEGDDEQGLWNAVEVEC